LQVTARAGVVPGHFTYFVMNSVILTMALQQIFRSSPANDHM